MAAPATTVRVSPDGIAEPLWDGYRALVAFSRFPGVTIWEKSVQPPGADGGDTIDVTTMHNDLCRTKHPRSLIDYTDGNMVVAYNPDAYEDIINLLINRPGAISFHFSDGSIMNVWGYLRTFEPQEMVEGEQPEANVAITVTNYDYVNCVESCPVIIEVEGCAGTI